jgi:cytochrome P450
MVGRLIADRRAHGGGRDGDGDLLDVLLTADLTDAEIGAEVATFMLGGRETTANTLAWSLALLSRERAPDQLACR